MKITYDTEADALYIYLHERKDVKVKPQELTMDILADYYPDGELAGLEILNAAEVLGECRTALGPEVTAVLEMPAKKGRVNAVIHLDPPYQNASKYYTLHLTLAPNKPADKRRWSWILKLFCVSCFSLLLQR